VDGGLGLVRAEWKSCHERNPPTPLTSALEQLSLPTLGAGFSGWAPDDLTAA
jgi:hypothetical protein